jgi:hypothetical protein
MSKSENGITLPVFRASGSTFAAICAISRLKLSTGIAAKTSSPVKTVFQLDHGNRRKHNLVLSVSLSEFRQQVADRLRFTFGDDQNAGIRD